VLTSFAGSRLFGEAYGSGRPWVLALHGWRRDHTDFEIVLRRPHELDALAVDLPGFGATPAPAAPLGSAGYAEALLPLFEVMAPRVVVIGHSRGGCIAAQLAGMAPSRVGGLVLTGAPLFKSQAENRPPPLAFRAVRRLAKGGLVTEAQLERARFRHGSDDYRAASGVMREVLVTLLAEHYEEALHAVSCPVELVWGERDTAAPLEVARRAQNALPDGANLTVCAGTGHMTPLEVPDALRQAVERLRPAPAT
jgi:pimeloyl-ACP methyl ester carboxylesterase